MLRRSTLGGWKSEKKTLCAGVLGPEVSIHYKQFSPPGRVTLAPPVEAEVVSAVRSAVMGPESRN